MNHTLISVNGVGDLSIFVLRDYWIDRTRCNAIGSNFEGVYCFCLNWAAGEGGGVFVPTIGALERDGVTAIGDGFVISAFHTALVAASVSFSSMTTGADGAGGEVLFA